MTTLIVSPHLDDAVFSLGRMMGGRATPVTVLTVHGGGDDARVEEDALALAALGAMWTVWDFHPDTFVPYLADVLAGVGRGRPHDQVLVPLGIYHPDHLAVSEACRAVDWGVTQVGVYEEIPYRVTWPDTAYQRRRVWGFPVNGQPEIQSGPLDLKLAAAKCYRSQLSDDIAEVLGVPERVWWR